MRTVLICLVSDNLLSSSIGFHKSRAALAKVKVIKILVYKHDYSSFVMLMLRIIHPLLEFVNRFFEFLKQIGRGMALPISY